MHLIYHLSSFKINRNDFVKNLRRQMFLKRDVMYKLGSLRLVKSVFVTKEISVNNLQKPTCFIMIYAYFQSISNWF